MNEECLQVLNMLASGKLSVEQANQLLDALDGAQPKNGPGVMSPSVVQPAMAPVAAPAPMPTPRPVRPQAPPSAAFTIDHIIALSERGVDPSYIVELREAGLTSLSVDQIITLHDHEIDADFVGGLKEAGITRFEELIKLHDHEIDADYVRGLQAAIPDQLPAR